MHVWENSTSQIWIGAAILGLVVRHIMPTQAEDVTEQSAQSDTMRSLVPISVR
jgi:hypothetical protein